MSRGRGRGLGREVRDFTVDLLRVRPAPHPRWPIATQGALAMAVPVTVFTALGQPAVGLQAAGGAFTALYLGSATVRERAKTLPLVGLLLLACAAAGTVAAVHPVLVVVGIVVVAIATSALTYGFSLGPPGPIFFSLVFGMAANVTAVVDGVRHVEPLPFLGAFAIGCAWAYVVAVAPLVVPSVHRRPARSLRAMLPGPALGPDARALLLRVVIVAVVGALLSALWVDQERVYWTVCAGIAVIGIAPGRRTAMLRGGQRFIGTLLGAGVFVVIALVGIAAPLLGLALGALQFAVEVLVVRNYAFALAFITPLVLLITTSAVPGADATALTGERILDTLIGALLGMLTAFIHPRADPSRPSRREKSPFPS